MQDHEVYSVIGQDHTRSGSILDDVAGSLMLRLDHLVFGRILLVNLFSGFYCAVKSIKLICS
jgi:hypothetical protein